MADSRTLKRLVGCGFAAAMVLAAWPGEDAEAARKKKRLRKRGKTLSVQRINVANASDVPGNQVIEVVFNTDVDPDTVNHAFMRIRGENGLAGGG